MNNRVNPYVVPLGSISPKEALEQAYWIRDNIPFFQKGTASGKFYENYISYAFWNDSNLDLIKNFVHLIQKNEDLFKTTFQRPTDLSFVYLSYVEDASQETCIWHKDGYWWSGQFHLTLLGDANILIRDAGLLMHVQAESGTVWYLNGTEYEHKIKSLTSKGPRFELLAPSALRQETRTRFMQAVTTSPERWIDSSHPAVREEVETSIVYMKDSIAKGRASNQNVAGWFILPQSTPEKDPHNP